MGLAKRPSRRRRPTIPEGGFKSREPPDEDLNLEHLDVEILRLETRLADPLHRLDRLRRLRRAKVAAQSSGQVRSMSKFERDRRIRERADQLGSAGQPSVIAQLGREFAVSRRTVQRALSEKTKPIA
jgi:hypothetical protein